MNRSLMLLLLLLMDLFLAVAGLVLLAALSRGLQTFGFSIPSRIFPRSGLNDLLITGVTILSLASLIAILLLYFILKKRGNRFAMFTISSLAFMVFVAELTLGIFFVIFFNQVQANVKSDLSRCLPYYGMEMVFTTDWDRLHQRFECCGADSYDDFSVTLDQEIPKSCCTPSTNSTLTDTKCPPGHSLFKQGCKLPVSDFIRKKSASLGAVFVFQSVIWFVVSAISSSIACSIKIRLKSEEEARRRTCSPDANNLHFTQRRRF